MNLIVSAPIDNVNLNFGSSRMIKVFEYLLPNAVERKLQKQRMMDMGYQPPSSDLLSFFDVEASNLLQPSLTVVSSEPRGG